MPALEPGTDSAALRLLLHRPYTDLVVCFCAAWCDTCREYRPKFDVLAERLTDCAFAWVDIEDHPDILGDEDVENFPTLLVSRAGRSVFYGPMLPHIGHLERLLASLDAASPQVDTRLPDVRSLLAA